MIRVLASLAGMIIIIALAALLYHFNCLIPKPISAIGFILLFIGFLFANFGINQLDYEFFEPHGDYKIVEKTRADNTKEYHPFRRLFWFVWAYMNYDFPYRFIEPCKTMEEAQQVINSHEASRVKGEVKFNINVIKQ